IPVGLSEVFQKMLAKRPQDRLQTPAEVATSLSRIAAALPAGAAGQRPEVRVATAAPRPAPFAIMVAGGSGAVAPAIPLPPPARGLRLLRRPRWLWASGGCAILAAVVLLALVVRPKGRQAAGPSSPLDALNPTRVSA